MKKSLRFFTIVALIFTAALAPSCKDDTKVYTVKFNSNGGSMFPWQFIEEGGKVVKPAPDSKRANFRFDGWFTDNYTFADEWDFDTRTVTADITLFAKWTAVLTVTFNSNGGSEVEPQIIAHGAKAVKPSPDPVKTGNLLVGWFTDNNTFKNEWDFDNIVTSNVALYAKWNINNVSFNKPVTVSDFLAGFPGELAVDGKYTEDINSRWVATIVDVEHWLEVDLEGSHVISTFKMWRQFASWIPLENMKQFRFQAWIDGDWVDVITEDECSSEKFPVYSKDFDPVTTDKVRLYFPLYPNNSIRLYELEVWGYKLD